MATIMSHALLAGTIYGVVRSKKSRLVLTLCLIGSISPDLDVLSFTFGIPYAHELGHRGFSHSILFALIYALVCLLISKNINEWSKLKLFLLYFISIMSHGTLDMLTNGGLGVGLLIPLSSERFFFPIRPLEVSPIGAHFVSKRGLVVLLNELKFIAVPCLIILFLRKEVK